LEDCVQALKRFNDKHFDLAIVDPPYGNVAVFENCQPLERKNERPKKYADKDWDKQKPLAEYWEQLFRVSKNQIVWGGNYMTEHLPPSRCWIFWDKVKFVDNYADGELAWTSFDKNTKKIEIQHHGFLTKDGRSIHPTQKPVMLYEWILKNYASDGDLILDTHLGSQSSRIAANKAGLDFVGFEIDREYFDNGNTRFKNFVSQGVLF